MEHMIKRQFVEDRATILDSLPVAWNVAEPGPYYCVTLKMSRIKDLAFDFEFGSLDSRDTFPVTLFPEKILKLDLSLNELVELQPDSLHHFENLMELNASFNLLHSVPGLRALPNLLVLDLSFNAVFDMDVFKTCSQLTTLILSYNKIRSMKTLPTLAHLTKLHLNSNKLCSLDGIQNLPKLHELYVHNNKISSLLPLATSLTLNILDASNNHICSFSEMLQILRGLRRLTQLSLKGNPLPLDSRYTSSIKQHTSVCILDNTILKEAMDIELSPVYRLLLRQSMDALQGKDYKKERLRDIIKNNFILKLKNKQDAVESIIHLFHKRILDLQEEFKEFEDNLNGEMENCSRYIDSIPQEDLESIDPHKVQRATEQYLFTKFWERWEHGKRRPGNLSFIDITDSEEVVKAAALLLSQTPGGASEE